MPNTNLTPQVITNELLRRFKNNLGFSGAIDHEYDEKFAQDGAKIGDTLKIRDAVRFSVTSGATLSIQDVTETYKTLTLDTQAHVGFAFSSKELTLDIDKFRERYLESAAVSLANYVDVLALTKAYQATANYVGTGATVPNAALTYLQANDMLDNNSAPQDGQRSVVVNPKMSSTIVDANKTLFQSGTQLKNQYERGRMGTAWGFDWIMDQNIRTHTVGAYVGTPLTNGAPAEGTTSVVTNGWTGSVTGLLKKGDIVTFQNSYAVNPVSGDTLDYLQPFVITADVNSTSGAATLPIYPALSASGPSKTVSALPGSGATISVKTGAASAVSPQGIAFHKSFMALGMAPLEVPKGVHFAAKQQDRETGTSIRLVSNYDITNDRFITRADILVGFVVKRPEWACRILS